MSGLAVHPHPGKRTNTFPGCCAPARIGPTGRENAPGRTGRWRSCRHRSLQKPGKEGVNPGPAWTRCLRKGTDAGRLRRRRSRPKSNLNAVEYERRIAAGLERRPRGAGGGNLQKKGAGIFTVTVCTCFRSPRQLLPGPAWQRHPRYPVHSNKP